MSRRKTIVHCPYIARTRLHDKSVIKFHDLSKKRTNRQIMSISSHLVFTDLHADGPPIY